jgi:hypothetical protein
MLLKFERMEPLGRWFAERLAEVARREAVAGDVDVVVPVPNGNWSAATIRPI